MKTIAAVVAGAAVLIPIAPESDFEIERSCAAEAVRLFDESDVAWRHPDGIDYQPPTDAQQAAQWFMAGCRAGVAIGAGATVARR